ncbi:MAG: hypothetical protein PVH65_06460 [Chloroflexota bacterium]|jgi:hypothetical protein
MERTVPRRGSDEIALYLRTYYSLLRSSREVQIKTLVEAHARMNSALHVDADKNWPDMAAFIYVILRLPVCIAETRLVVMGQSEKVFEEHGYEDVESWQEVSSPGRRRRNYYDGQGTLAVYIASRSDIDDIIPSLTAYQIERRKLHQLLRDPQTQEMLSRYQDRALPDEALSTLSDYCGIAVEDLDRLRRIWGAKLGSNLLRIARDKYSVSVRLLAGSLADYKRATRRWWLNACLALPDIRLEDRPVYFVSSNTHSLTNLLSNFALTREKELVKYIEEQGSEDLRTEYVDILERNVPSSRENFLYYVLKKYEAERPETRYERLHQERQLGIYRAPSQHVFDVEVQFVELSKLRPECLDPRLRIPGIEQLRESDALIINIDFPLGMAAYLVLSEVARNIAAIRGVYIMGKAATLNGRIGDVMIPSMVYDEQSLNTYLFDNCFSADDIAPLLVYGTVMDNQKAITALGTFLQNESYMDVIYREGYTVIEMEAGPYLSSIYEMTRPQRYPRNEIVNIYHAPFPIGIVHYASDTPFSKGKNLGSQNLSYFGMDPTYATMTAILQQILAGETGRQ